MHQAPDHLVAPPLPGPRHAALRPRACRAIATLLMGAGLAACGGAGTNGDAATDVPAPVVVAAPVTQEHAGEHGAFQVRERVTGLVHPWSLAFLPGGDLLVTERPGRLRRIGADGSVSAPITGVPAVFAQGQSGLLDVVLSPDFARDGLVYLAYGEPNWRGNKGGTAIARGRLEGDALHDVQVIFRQEPKLSFGTHVGARLLFDREGYLYASAGDNRDSGSAQLLDHLQGKIVRLLADGRVPADNPFVGRDGAVAAIWSYGHRNPQGLALHPDTGAVWSHEHGPRGGDEINIARAGRNYGWPIITYGLEYSGQPVAEATGTQAPGMEQPLHWWPVSPAISGMAFYSGDAFPAWRGNLFIGALATRELIRLELDGERVVHEERLLAARGERIRDVRVGPDGHLYLLTDDAAGKLLELSPAPTAVPDAGSGAPTGGPASRLP